jgi:PAS domain S-box-containing protein
MMQGGVAVAQRQVEQNGDPSADTLLRICRLSSTRSTRGFGCVSEVAGLGNRRFTAWSSSHRNLRDHTLCMMLAGCMDSQRVEVPFRRCCGNMAARECMRVEFVVGRLGAMTSHSGSALGVDLAAARFSVLFKRTYELLTERFAGQLILVFVAYFIAGKLGQATSEIRSGNIGPVWPAFGIALASVLAFGPRVWPAIVASAAIVAFQSPVSVFAAIGQAFAATLAVVTGASVLRRIPGFNPSMRRLRDALAFIGYGAFGSATISATLGLASLYVAGAAGYSGLGAAWLIYWLGDATGALLVTPLVFTLASALRFQSWRRTIEYGVLLALVTLICIVIFAVAPFGIFESRLMMFAVMPFVMWAAISFGTGAAALVVLLIATIATLATATGSGPFAEGSAFIAAVRLDLTYGVLAITGLSLAALIAEREAGQAEQQRLIRSQVAMEARLHLAAIVESSNDAVLSMSLDGIILSWNAAAERIFGFTRAEAIGRPVSMLIPSWHGPVNGVALQRLAEGQAIDPYEAMGITKSEGTLNLSVTIAPLRDAEGTVFGMAAIVRDITANKRAEEAVSQLSRRLLEAQEQERRRIARELHDDIGQRLATLAFNLAGSTELQQQVTELAADVQALSHELHSSRIELLGVSAAMRHFCAEFSAQQNCAVDFASQDLPSELRPEISLCLFRILQEGVHNATKHSGVRQVEVRLRGADGHIHLTVRDHGKGFDVAAARGGRGIGLISMEERVKLVGGDLTISSQPNGGATIHARVPFSP